MSPPETQREREVEDTAIFSSALWRRAALASVVALLLLALVAGLAQRQNLRHQQALFRSEGSYAISLEREFLTRELQAVQSDLLFLAQQPLLARMLAGDAPARPALEREYAGFARSKPLYDQIRFLDETGQEVVRINRRGDVVEIVEAGRLQSKATRYYFREAIDLEVGGVFVSPLDLNVEHGEIERPPKPMIRLATPVADRMGEIRGVLVLNYAGARLLGKLREISGAARGDMTLVNMQGEYLRAPDPRREWGWLLGHSESFRNDHPAAWERIREAERAQLQIGDDLFTAERVQLAPGAGAINSAMVIVSRIPMSKPIDLTPDTVALLLGAVVGTVMIAFLWARATVAHRLQEQRIAESEARLRVLSRRLLAAQEEERRSLSRMLHDELGQRVTAIVLDLKAILRRRGDEATAPLLRRVVEEADGVLSSLHEIATRVRPSVLDDLGLEDAIESYISEYEKRTGVSVETETRLPPEGLPDAVGENLYRILQEALSNVSAHAGTDTARVKLVAEPSGLELTIEDEGRGFDTEALNSSSRLGILGMRERVELLGGEFDLDAAPGRGTRIHIRLSLPVQ